VEAMRKALDSGAWELVRNDYATTIRWDQVVQTPESIREKGIWTDPTYNRHVFVSVVTGHPWSLTLGTSRAPWVCRTDSTLTFRRAFEILARPEQVFQ